MQNKKIRFSSKKIFSLFLILVTGSLLFAQETKFPQTIKWRSDKNAYYYRVEVQNQTTGKSDIIKTEKNQLELSLQPGKYRYRIYVYDFLGREAGVNQWTSFEILKASKPEITLLDKKVYIPESGDYFNINAKITGVSAKSTVILINEETGHEVKGELLLQNDSKSASETANAVRARFYYVRPGKWHLKITNSSGYSSQSESFEIIDSANLTSSQKTQELEAALKKAEAEKITEEEVQKKVDEAVAKALEEERTKNQEEKAKSEEEKSMEIARLQEENKKALAQARSAMAGERGMAEVGVYFKDFVPLEHMENHAVNFLGGGLAFNLNFFPLLSVNPGFCLHVDAETVMANLSYIEEWYSAAAFGGFFLEFSLNDYFAFVPTVEGGVFMDFVRSSVTDNELYFSPAVQGSLALKVFLTGRKNSGLSIEAAPYYIGAFEKKEMAHYLGGKIGFVYNIGRKSVKNTDDSSVSPLASTNRE